MKRLLVLALMAVMAAGAAAEVPCSPNTLGLYWDMEFTQTNVDPTPFTAVPLYIVLSKGTMPDGVDAIKALEASLVFPAACGFFQSAVIAGGGVNDGTPDNMFLFWPVALPVDPAGHVLLATFNYFMITTGVGGDLLLGPGVPATIAGKMVIINHDITIAVAATHNTHPDTWDENGFGVVATIFGEGVVATESATLSGVKDLFR